jgi:hypothetical protein
MLLELIRAIFQAGLPVGLTSYLLVWWALKSDYLGSVASLKDVDREIKRLSKAKSEEKKRKKSKKKKESGLAVEDLGDPGAPTMNPVHNKWMAFGGGFYGSVALLTYLVVELGEIREFLAGLDSIAALFSRLGVDLLIRLIINSLLNFLTAIAWPLYWLAEIDGRYLWLWLVVAYGGYYGGARFALRRGAQPA